MSRRSLGVSQKKLVLRKLRSRHAIDTSSQPTDNTSLKCCSTEQRVVMNAVTSGISLVHEGYGSGDAQPLIKENSLKPLSGALGTLVQYSDGDSSSEASTDLATKRQVTSAAELPSDMTEDNENIGENRSTCMNLTHSYQQLMSQGSNKQPVDVCHSKQKGTSDSDAVSLKNTTRRRSAMESNLHIIKSSANKVVAHLPSNGQKKKKKKTLKKPTTAKCKEVTRRRLRVAVKNVADKLDTSSSSSSSSSSSCNDSGSSSDSSSSGDSSSSSEAVVVPRIRKNLEVHDASKKTKQNLKEADHATLELSCDQETSRQDLDASCHAVLNPTDKQDSESCRFVDMQGSELVSQQCGSDLKACKAGKVIISRQHISSNHKGQWMCRSSIVDEEPSASPNTQVTTVTRTCAENSTVENDCKMHIVKKHEKDQFKDETAVGKMTAETLPDKAGAVADDGNLSELANLINENAVTMKEYVGGLSKVEAANIKENTCEVQPIYIDEVSADFPSSSNGKCIETELVVESQSQEASGVVSHGETVTAESLTVQFVVIKNQTQLDESKGCSNSSSISNLHTHVKKVCTSASEASENINSEKQDAFRELQFARSVNATEVENDLDKTENQPVESNTKLCPIIVTSGQSMQSADVCTSSVESNALAENLDKKSLRESKKGVCANSGNHSFSEERHAGQDRDDCSRSSDRNREQHFSTSRRKRSRSRHRNDNHSSHHSVTRSRPRSQNRHTTSRGHRSGSHEHHGTSHGRHNTNYRHHERHATSHKRGSHGRRSDSHARRSGSHARRSGSHGRRSGSHGRRSGSHARRSGSHARRSGSHGRRSGSHGRRSGSHAHRSGSRGRRSGSRGPRSGSHGRRSSSRRRHFSKTSKRCGDDRYHKKWHHSDTHRIRDRQNSSRHRHRRSSSHESIKSCSSNRTIASRHCSRSPSSTQNSKQVASVTKTTKDDEAIKASDSMNFEADLDSIPLPPNLPDVVPAKIMSSCSPPSSLGALPTDKVLDIPTPVPTTTVPKPFDKVLEINDGSDIESIEMEDSPSNESLPSPPTKVTEGVPFLADALVTKAQIADEKYSKDLNADNSNRLHPDNNASRQPIKIVINTSLGTAKPVAFSRTSKLVCLGRATPFTIRPTKVQRSFKPTQRVLPLNVFADDDDEEEDNSVATAKPDTSATLQRSSKAIGHSRWTAVGDDTSVVTSSSETNASAVTAVDEQPSIVLPDSSADLLTSASSVTGLTSTHVDSTVDLTDKVIQLADSSASFEMSQTMSLSAQLAPASVKSAIPVMASLVQSIPVPVPVPTITIDTLSQPIAATTVPFDSNQVIALPSEPILPPETIPPPRQPIPRQPAQSQPPIHTIPLPNEIAPLPQPPPIQITSSSSQAMVLPVHAIPLPIQPVPPPDSLVHPLLQVPPQVQVIPLVSQGFSPSAQIIPTLTQYEPILLPHAKEIGNDCTLPVSSEPHRTSSVSQAESYQQSLSADASRSQSTIGSIVIDSRVDAVHTLSRTTKRRTSRWGALADVADKSALTDLGVSMLTSAISKSALQNETSKSTDQYDPFDCTHDDDDDADDNDRDIESAEVKIDKVVQDNASAVVVGVQSELVSLDEISHKKSLSPTQADVRLLSVTDNDSLMAVDDNRTFVPSGQIDTISSLISPSVSCNEDDSCITPRKGRVKRHENSDTSFTPARRRSSRLRDLEKKTSSGLDNVTDALDSDSSCRKNKEITNSQAQSIIKSEKVCEGRKVKRKRGRGKNEKAQGEMVMNSGSIPPPPPPPPPPQAPLDKRDEFNAQRPEKVKSRWLRWSEMEAEAEANGDTANEAVASTQSNSDLVLSSNTSFEKQVNDTISLDISVSPTVGDLQPVQLFGDSLADVTSSPLDISQPIGTVTETLFPAAEKLLKAEEKQIEVVSSSSARPHFEEIIDNEYICERKRSKAKKEARRMVCDCILPTSEELQGGMLPCGEDCLNRLLMIECGSRCPCGDDCRNKRFSKHQYAHTEVFKTEDKGWGLNIAEDLHAGTFVMEYVGEVLDYEEFRKRTGRSRNHFYFMALSADEILDASNKGNVSRFINHSCDPNCETQKWTVNGQLRVGFFTVKPVQAGDELTFDYRFELYGKEAQKCYCGTANCSGFIGGQKTKSLRSYGRSLSSSSSSSLAAIKSKKEKKTKVFDDLMLEEEIEKMSRFDGLRRRAHVLEHARLMVRAESTEQRLALLKILQDTKEKACLRLFLDYHGLSLIWSWMVDLPDSAFDLKTRILETLSLLPIQNKTMLTDSRIMSVVERWGQLTTATTPPHTTDEDQAYSAQNSYQGVPNKKRHLLRHLQEDASSSEGELSDSNRKHPNIVVQSAQTISSNDKMEKVVKPTEDIGSESSSNEADLAASNTEINAGTTVDTVSESSQDALEVNEATTKLAHIASQLVGNWSSLKESFRIPKRQVEERKKTEQEVEKLYSHDGDRELDRDRGHDRDHERVRDHERNRDHDRNRERDRGRDHRSSRDDYRNRGRSRERERDRKRSHTPEQSRGKRRRHHSEDDNKSLTPRRTLLPSPPRITKKERREAFEAQIKAQDEIQKLAQEQQQQQHQLMEPVDGLQQFYSPATFVTPTDFPTTNHPVEYVQDGIVYQDPAALGLQMTPMLQGGVVQTTALATGQQMIMQPDGTLIPAPQPVQQQLELLQQSPQIQQQHILQQQQLQLQQQLQQQQQQPVIATVMAAVQQNVVEQSPGATYVEQTATPPLAYQQTPNYQVQAMSSSFTSMSAPQSVGFVQSNSQPSAQSAATPQLYYSTPQGQLIPAQPQTYPTLTAATQLIQIADPSMLQLQQQQQQQRPTDPREPPPPPPSPPPKPSSVRLPPNWKTAKDAAGKTYYYHTSTRQTQWDAPTWDGLEVEDDMDLGTPTHDDTTSKKRTTTAAADTSSEAAKRMKDHFRSKISRHIVTCLNPYRKPDCQMGRISNTDDFKHLARKITHAVLNKEMKHCRHVEDLEVNENVKSKARDYVKKYMSRFGVIYKKSANSP